MSDGATAPDRSSLIRGVASVVLIVGMLGLVGLVLSVPPPGAADAAPSRSTTTAAPRSTVPTTALPTTTAPLPTVPPDEVLPESGWGRRIVFSIARQRMWWVDDSGTVVRTSLVSGRENTPATGVFQVYSRTLNATGLDGSKMDHFVRFTKGENGWAIGFHGIPTVDGVPVQTEEELGQPLSHGCIRQRAEDAAFTWDFLADGDNVVVVA